ncbi:MAG: T9SS type A sorting domain-containing protein [Saprospiraceae bacterium]|nr:T9SS type A sorting domain-containing protein [Saprospiraceae bacterium]
MFIFIDGLAAQNAINRSVQVSAKFMTSPDRLEFSWPWDWSDGGYSIYRKHPDSTGWGQPIFMLPWGSTSFTDYSINANSVFEYAFFKKRFETVAKTVQVPAGSTLVFTIENIYGNGLCCNFGHGWYLTSACGNILSGGSDFGFAKSDTITICNNGQPTEPLTVTINPDMLVNNTWWKLKTLTGQVIDSSGAPGTNLAERPKYGYILAGSNLSAVENRGSLLLVVDVSYSQPLANEIAQLELDLWGDGWNVHKIEVNPSDAVPAVKSLIVNKFQQLPDLKTVYLLGHVPVPYSGNFYADGHLESHWGAWPADVYYGEMNGIWTDAIVNNTTALDTRTQNVAGDGKFDQSDIPTKAELAVGRVDLTNMPSFGLGHIELTRRYLQKAHAFKTGQLNVPHRALVDDNLGIALGAPAASGWRNFAPMFTADSVQALDYFSTMKNEAYLWSFGGGSGTPTSANGIGSTQDFANDSLRNIFTMLCGSFFGDWDSPDNFLRAPLASPGWTLTSCWAGNPPFTLHRMAMGEPIGQSLLRTQNATEGDYYPGPQLVHTSLMGDPSLRLHPVKPIDNLTATETVSGVEISWTAPAGETVAGYNIYRAENPLGDFVKINSNLVTATSFLDIVQPVDSALYMVRVVKLETTGSGSYWNMSLGKTAWSSGDPCNGLNMETELMVSICEGQSFVYNDTTYSQSGIYEHHFPAANGCDSMVLVYLEVLVSPTVNLSASICEGESFPVGDTTLSETGLYELVIYNDMGCLQRLVVALTVGPVYEIEIDSNYVPPIVVDGVSHSGEFTVTYTLTSSLGCDSIVNFNFYPLVASQETLADDLIRIYPNPSSGQFFIENNTGIQGFSIELFNGMGQQVFAQQLGNGSQTKIDIRHLPSAVYWLKVKGATKEDFRKIVLIQ